MERLSPVSRNPSHSPYRHSCSHGLDWRCQWCDRMKMRPQLLDLGISGILKGHNACREIQLPLQRQRGDFLTHTTESLPGGSLPVTEQTSRPLSYCYFIYILSLMQRTQLRFRSLTRSLCCYPVTRHYELILLSCLTQNLPPAVPMCTLLSDLTHLFYQWPLLAWSGLFNFTGL